MRIITLFLITLFLIVSFSSAETLMTFTRQSGGRTGEYTMTTTDGTVWTSNNSVYSNSNYYYMDYMFDGSHASSGWGTGWLVNNTYDPKWLTITFAEEIYITHINTFPIMYPSYYVSSHLSTSTDGVNFTHQGDVIVGNHNNDSDYYNYSVDIDVNQMVKTIKFEFFDQVSFTVLTELEIFTDTAPVGTVPEPGSFILALSGILLFCLYCKN